MKIEFINKVVVITGASGGLGSKMAEDFAVAGATVIACDLRNTKEIVDDITSKGFKAVGYDFDITDREQTVKIFNDIGTKFGKIDVLINNAGINVGSDERFPIDKFSDKWFDAIVEVDLIGLFNCSKAAIPFMLETGANIINISSITGMVGLRLQCAFTAAKGGVINMTRAMALELADRGIRVNSIAPGTVGIEKTKDLWRKDDLMERLLSHIPQKRQAKPSEISNVAMFIASDYASYMTGAIIPVDGGWTCGGYARNF